jgi:hypothetical protein
MCEPIFPVIVVVHQCKEERPSSLHTCRTNILRQYHSKKKKLSPHTKLTHIYKIVRSGLTVYATNGVMKQERPHSSTAIDILTQQLGRIHFLPHTELITDYNMNWLHPTSHHVCNSENYRHAAVAALPHE